MPPLISRITRLLVCAIATALAVPTPASLLHAQPATTARREGISLSLGSGWTELAGTASKGGVLGGGSFGLAYERPLGSRVGLRVEGSINELRTDLGETGDIFSLPTTLSAARFGLGLQARRYSSRAAYVGAGVTVSANNSCLVDTEGGPGFLGGSTEECEEFTELTLRPRSGVLGTVLTAGVQRGRWEYEVRYDQAVATTIDTDVGPLRGRSVTGVAHYRFGARPRAAGPPTPNDMRPPRSAEPSAPRFAHQMGISAAGFLLGIAAGAGIGALSASVSGEEDNLDEVGTGIFAGAVLGPALALHIDGARHGRRANFLATVIGSFLGSAVGAIAAYGAPGAAIPIVLVSAPVGATVGYRLTDRAR